VVGRARLYEKALCQTVESIYFSSMSKTAEALLQEFQKLPLPERQGLLQQLLQSLSPTPPRELRPFPTVKLDGGRITSEQVAETLDDE
jgi:hypothetical protein